MLINSYRFASAATSDPNFANVSLLLHGNGTNGSTTITDSGPTPKTVTAVGNAQISTAQSKFGGASIAFDGIGDYIDAPANPAFSFGTENFTVEMFAYWNSFSNVNVFFDTRTGGGGPGIVLLTASTGVITFGGPVSILSSALSLATWYHVAATRSGLSFRLFVNGIQQGGTATSVANLTSSNFFVGRTNEANVNFFNGYIDELRITKGIARYTANFTPPTDQFPDS
jgi:hypothetical protein